MTGIAIFCFFIGTLIGTAIVPVVYGIRYLKKRKKKYGFREHRPAILEADSTILESKREEHSAQEYH